LLAWWTARRETEQAWRVPVGSVLGNGFNLDVKNPNSADALEHLAPAALAAEILAAEQRIVDIVVELQAALDESSK
jgi:type I restriction enzyme M protein